MATLGRLQYSTVSLVDTALSTKAIHAYLLNMNENIDPSEDTDKNGPSNVTHNGPKLKRNQMSTDNRILHSHKNK